MNSDIYTTSLFLALAVAFASSLLLTRVVRRVAIGLELLDPCNDRSLHKEPLPRLGGIAVSISVTAGLTAIALLFPRVIETLGRQHFVLLAGAVAMHLLGLADDVWQMRARYKLGGQLLIASAVYLGGLRIPDILLPGGLAFALPGALNMLLTVAWLVGITNAMNLIDGLDGLAAGVALIALAAFFSVSVTFGQPGAALLCCAFAGATAGFLKYNFEPASIFLGDSGSLLLGFTVAGVGLISSMKVPGSMALAVPLLALGLPIVDTGLAIFRRHLRHYPIFQADKGHIHHRLLARGFSPRRVAILLYALSAVFGAAAVVLASLGAHVLFPIIVGALGVGAFIQWLSYDEFQELGVLVGRAMRHRDSIGRNVRLREASLRIANLGNMTEILETLESTFKGESIPRVELRLERWFLNGKISGTPRPRRERDELQIWSLSDCPEPHPEWWEVCFPLIGPDDTRIGSLIVWENTDNDTRSVSYLQVINRALREQLQAKLHGFEWAIASAVNTSGVGLDSDGVAIGANGLPVASAAVQLPPLRHTTPHHSTPTPHHATTPTHPNNESAPNQHAMAAHPAGANEPASGSQAMQP